MKLSPALLVLAGLVLAQPAPPLFVDATDAAGLKFVHINGASGQYYIAEQMGKNVI